jgi:UDP-glucose 4-epimerase
MAAQLILVSGVSGFLGRVIAQKLLSTGYRVRGLDISSTPPLTHPQFEYLQASFLQDPFSRDLMREVDTVIHAANTYKPGPALDNYISDLEQNVIGTLRFYESAKASGVRRFLFLSSGGTVYGPAHGPSPIAETAHCAPISYYGLSKLTTENYLRRAASTHPNSLCILRIANPFGVNQRANTGQGLIATVIASIQRQEAVRVWGDGTAVRDYVHVDDVAACLDPVIRYQGPHDTFNIGSGIGRSVTDVINTVGRAMGVEPVINYESSRFVDVPFNVLSVDRAETEFGWAPSDNWGLGIEELVRAYSSGLAN